MAQELHIKTKCPQCVGSGEYVPPGGGGPLSCPMCNATGWLDVPPYVQKIVLDPGMDDIIDKCNDILDKCDDILEKLNE